MTIIYIISIVSLFMLSIAFVPANALDNKINSTSDALVNNTISNQNKSMLSSSNLLTNNSSVQPGISGSLSGILVDDDLLSSLDNYPGNETASIIGEVEFLNSLPSMN